MASPIIGICCEADVSGEETEICERKVKKYQRSLGSE